MPEGKIPGRLAWKSIVEIPERKKAYQNKRGKGGFVRLSWEEAPLLIAADRYGGENVTLASFLTVAAGAGIMSAGAQSMASAISGMMLLAMGMGLFNAAVFKLVPKFSPKSVGGASGIIGGLGSFGGFVLPLIIGIFVKISGNVGYSHGFMVFAGLSVVSLPLLLLVKRRTTELIG